MTEAEEDIIESVIVSLIESREVIIEAHALLSGGHAMKVYASAEMLEGAIGMLISHIAQQSVPSDEVMDAFFSGEIPEPEDYDS